MSMRHDTGWMAPKEPIWYSNDGAGIRNFYYEKVHVDQDEWSENCRNVDDMLEKLFPRLKREAAESYPGIKLKGFIRQGSSREGLKVESPDEFDIVVPFEFEGVDTKVLAKKEAQFVPLPAGYAQIEVLSISDGLQRKYPKLVKHINRKALLNTKYLHDSIFKGMVDKMLQNFQSDSVVGHLAKYSVTRKSNAPALIIVATVREPTSFGNATSVREPMHYGPYGLPTGLRGPFAPATNVWEPTQCGPTTSLQGAAQQRPAMSVRGPNTTFSIDFVPGFVYDQIYRKPKLLVSKWVPESKLVTMDNPITDPETATTIMKLSFYEREVEFIQDRRGQPISEYLIAAFRILKGLRKADADRKPQSQFVSVVSSYHMKNVLMYSLLFESYIRPRYQISGVTEALGCLIAMIRLCLEVKNLPKFFISNPELRNLYPNEDFHRGNAGTRMNILAEYIYSLPQVRRDFDEALAFFGLEDLSETPMAKALSKYFKNHICSK